MLRSLNQKLLLVPVFGLVMAFSQPAIAADTPVAAIPADSGLIIRLKAPEKTIKTVADAVNKIQPGIGDVVAGQASIMGLVISNVTLQGVDQNKDWWVAAFPESGEDPQIVFLIPATDIDDMHDAIDESFTFIKHGSWGIYSESEEATKKCQACIDGTAKSVKAAMTGKTLETFDTGQVSAYFNLNVVTTVYADEMTELRGSMNEFLETLSELDVDTPGMNMAAVVDMYSKIFDTAFKVAKDAESAVVSVRFDKAGFQIDELLTAKDGTKTAKYFSSYDTQDATPLLTKLPSGELLYFTLSANWAKLQAWGLKVSTAMYELNDEQQKHFDELQESLKDAKLGSIAGSMSLGDLNDGAIHFVQMGEVETPKNWQKMMELTAKAMSKLEVGGMTQSVSLQKDAETIDDKKVDILRYTMDFGEDNPAAEMQQQMMDMLYGPEGITARLTYLDKTYIQTMGGGKAAMQRALKANESASNASKGTALNRDRAALGDNAFLTVLVDYPRLVSDVMILVADSGLLPIPLDSGVFKDLELSKSYSGLSLSMKDRAVHCRTVVPFEQIENAYNLGMAVYKMSQDADEAF